MKYCVRLKLLHRANRSPKPSQANVSEKARLAQDSIRVGLNVRA